MKINKIKQSFSQNSLRVSIKNTLFIMFLVTFSPVRADDTEIFYTESEVNNNVLFIMDNSGSMSQIVTGTSASEDDTTTVTSVISHIDDDAEEFVNGNSNHTITYTASSDLGLTFDRRSDWVNGGGTAIKEEQIVGLRFDNIDIPQGATITSAYIQFTADEDALDASADTATLDIKIQSHDDGARFTNGQNKNIANRSLYSDKVTWSPPPWLAPLEKDWTISDDPNERGAQITPNLNDLVQLVIDRGGWQENNALVFVISGDSYRSARSRNQGEDDAPILTINYYEAGEKTRMQVMKDALKTVLNNAPDNLSVGIMNYGTPLSWRENKTNGVKFPVTSVNSEARPIVEAGMTLDGIVRWDLSNIPEPEAGVPVRTFLSQIVDEWEPKGMTPIVESLYEAARYFRGEEVFNGWGKSQKGVNGDYAANPTTYDAEPFTTLLDEGSCSASPYSIIKYNDDIAKWDAGDTGGYKCPADRHNPTGPGSAANCVLTKRDYLEYDYLPCTKRSPKVTTCTGIDENGDPINCTTTGNVCIEYGDRIYRKKATYSRCRDAELPKPEYISPIVGGCQSNFMILMSDGKPEYSRGTNVVPSAYYPARSMMNGTNCANKPFGYRSGECGAELTKYLSENDNISDIDGDQFINTYVIGFSEGVTAEAEGYLKSLVTLEDNPDTENKEGYFSATNEAELAEAFTQALDEIAQEARSQASPGYSVNVKSGLEHEKDIYIPVFDKSSSSVWSGNLKKFRIVDDNGERKIRGKVTQAGNSTGAGYIDAMTELGLFKDDAWDEFSNSPIPDGNAVELGGTAGLLVDPDARNLYSNISGNSNVTLSSVGNHIKITNTNITNDSEYLNFNSTELGLNNLEGIEYRSKLINFIRGWQGGVRNSSSPHGTARKHMGDMLHSEPVIITYPDDTQFIFAATNEGYLHAFDSSTGEEKFAFMPKELLKNIHSQFTGQGPHLYGIDGSISYWHDEATGKITLFFGMRRGGQSYYALDVTNINSPKLLWKADNNDFGLGRLGQSWSMPYLARIKHNGVKKEVVIITAGHDPYLDYENGDDYDPNSVTTDRTSTTMGDDIFILDAANGNYLWSMRQAGLTAVAHGLPGGVRILDVNRNGLVDRMYFADTGGNVWRLDLSETLSSDVNDYNLTKFASLGGSGENSRKFYNEPDVAQLSVRGKTAYSISVGSGLRPHPMNDKINDHMFVLLDESPLDKLADDFETIQFNDYDLSKVSVTVSDSSKSVTQSSDFEGKYITETQNSDGTYKRGWYVNFFESGEKVLAQSITMEGSLVFTTLVPKSLTEGDLINACAAPATQGRLYAFDILTGEASIDLSKDSNIDDDDVFETISASEIPGTPQRVFNELKCDSTETDACDRDGDGNLVHQVDIRIGKKSTQVGQDDVADIESIYWSDPNE